MQEVVLSSYFPNDLKIWTRMQTFCYGPSNDDLSMQTFSYVYIPPGMLADCISNFKSILCGCYFIYFTLRKNNSINNLFLFKALFLIFITFTDCKIIILAFLYFSEINNISVTSRQNDWSSIISHSFWDKAFDSRTYTHAHT